MVDRIFGPRKTINYDGYLPSPLPAPPSVKLDMDHHRFSSAQSILAGTAVAEDGYVYGTIVGDHCKDSVPFVVEVLDKVCDVFHILRKGLRQHRH